MPSQNQGKQWLLLFGAIWVALLLWQCNISPVPSPTGGSGGGQFGGVGSDGETAGVEGADVLAGTTDTTVGTPDDNTTSADAAACADIEDGLNVTDSQSETEPSAERPDAYGTSPDTAGDATGLPHRCP